MKPYYEHAGITIICGDCREFLPQLEAESIITDPIWPNSVCCSPFVAGSSDLFRSASVIFRALQAVKLLTRIRRENPELWKLIQEFAKGNS